MNARMMKIFTFTLIFFNMFYGALYIFLGRILPSVYFPSYIVKVLLVVLYIICIIRLLISKKIHIYVNSKYVFFYLSILLIIFIDFLFIVRFGYDLNYLINVFSSNLFYLFISTAYLFGNSNMDTLDKNKIYEFMYRLLAGICIVVFIFAIYQHLSRKLIIFNGFNDVNGYFSINYIGNKLRITSIFSNALIFGIFSVIVLEIMLCRILFKNFSMINLCILFMSIYCVYVTYTRNVYIYAMFSTITLIIIYMQTKINIKLIDIIIKILPIIFLLGSVFIGVYLVYFSNLLNGNDLSNTSSLTYRLNIWRHYMQIYFKDADFLNILFGFGVVQNSNIIISNGLISDNTFLNVYVFQGIIGLLCLILLYFVNWSIMIKNIKNKNWFEISFICFMSAYLACGYFNDFSYGNYYQICIAILIISLNNLEKRKDSKNENKFYSSFYR